MKTSKQLKKELDKLETAYYKALDREERKLQKLCKHKNTDRWISRGHNDSFSVSKCLNCGKYDV